VAARGPRSQGLVQAAPTPSKDGEDNKLAKSTPLDFLNYAEAYARAGEAAKDAIGNDRYPEPVYYLFGQSIELSLKAYLMGQETPIKILSSRPYGHDRNALLDLATEKGLFQKDYLYPGEHGTIRVLSNPYSLRRFQYSRLELGKSYPHPYIYYVERAASRLVQIVRRYSEGNSPGKGER